MISVVIVTHNSEACVGASIDALAKWLPDAERLVIDNASTDHSRAVAERHGATVVELHENLGFGRACNVGVRRAKQDHVLFLNPDVTIQAADTSEMVKLLGATRFGLVVPAAASRFTFPDRHWSHEVLSLTLGTLRPREIRERSPSPRRGQAAWASGAALLVRVSEFLALGGFDPRYFLYFEDRDLSWKYRTSGLSVDTTRAFIANHPAGGSSEVGDRRSELLTYSLMGLLQYTYVAHGPRAAERAWGLMRRTRAASICSVAASARIIPSSRLRRKSVQLEEVTQALNRITASSGVLKQSDDYSYWPDAVATCRRSATS